MKTDIDKLFENLEGQFDVDEPKVGHQIRFINRSKAEQLNSKKPKARPSFYWKTVFAVAATIVISLGVFTSLNSQPEFLDLASVSPELSKTEDFFTITIQEELKTLNAKQSPLTKDIIYDALRQITLLENKYNDLKRDLKESGQDKRVIYAMISNFQSRIDVLTHVLEQIENVNQLKLNTNETSNII